MMSAPNNHPRPAPTLIVVLTILLLFATAPPLSVASSWLKQGTDLLEKAITTPTPKTKTDSRSLTLSEVAAGLKEALRVGTATVVDKLGLRNGFFNDSQIHIPLPSSLRSVQNALRPVGLSSMLDDLELKLNRAAESAVPLRDMLPDPGIQTRRIGQRS